MNRPIDRRGRAIELDEDIQRATFGGSSFIVRRHAQKYT
jgi:hypothetical protein